MHVEDSRWCAAIASGFDDFNILPQMLHLPLVKPREAAAPEAVTLLILAAVRAEASDAGARARAARDSPARVVAITPTLQVLPAGNT